jgi:hypothetical protein
VLLSDVALMGGDVVEHANSYKEHALLDLRGAAAVAVRRYTVLLRVNVLRTLRSSERSAR